jgi:guanine deaminase
MTPVMGEGPRSPTGTSSAGTGERWLISRVHLAEPDGETSRLGPAVDIAITGAEIAAVLPHDPTRRAGDRLDGAGRLALPGLVNGHTHSHEALYRGRYEKSPLELWMNHVRPPWGGPALSDEDVYSRTALVALEALETGATCIVDDVALGAGREAEHLDAVLRAYTDAGLRAFVAPTLFDGPFATAVPWAEELPSTVRDLPAPPGRRLLALAAELVHSRRPGEDIVCGAFAPSAPQRCSPGFLEEVASAADGQAPILTHVCETRVQAVTAQRRYGRTMVAELDEAGVLGPLTTAIHGVWLRPDDLARLARAGATVQHNPVSNLRLGSGIAPVAALRTAGVRVSLGSDGCGSCVSTGMLDTVRMASLLHSLRGVDPRQWVTTAEAYAMGSAAGAEALGLGDRLGRIGPGQLADLCLYELQGPGMTPLHDPLAQLVHAPAGRSPSHVIVSGRILVADGLVRTLDVTRVRARVRELHDRVRSRLDEDDRRVRTLRAGYGRILARAAREPIPYDTIPARLADGAVTS